MKDHWEEISGVSSFNSQTSAKVIHRPTRSKNYRELTVMLEDGSFERKSRLRFKGVGYERGGFSGGRKKPSSRRPH